MPKLLKFDTFTLLIRKKNVAIHVLLRCKIFSLKIWLCKIFDKFHVWIGDHGVSLVNMEKMEKMENINQMT